MTDLLPPRRFLPPQVEPAAIRASADDDLEPLPQGIDLKEIFSVLRRHLLLVLVLTLAGVAAAGYVVYRRQPVYSASAVVRLADARRALTGGLDNSGTDRYASYWTDPVLSQIQVLQSRAVAREVVEHQALGVRVIPRRIPAGLLTGVSVDDNATADTILLTFDVTGYVARGKGGERRARYGVPVEMDGVSFAVTRAPQSPTAALVLIPPDEAVSLVAGRIGAQSRKNTDVVDVTYTANDPHVAQQVVNAIVTSFQALNVEAAQQQSRRRRVFVEEQLRQTDSLLGEAQNALSAFRSREQIYSSKERLAAEQTGLMALEARREELEADRRVMQSLLGRLQQPRDSAGGDALRALVSSPSVAENPVVVQLYTQLAQYEAVRDSLTTGAWASATTHPDVQRATALVRSTEQKLKEAVESHVTALEARIVALEQLRDRNASVMSALPSTEVTEERLQQQVESTRKLADQLREEYQRARIAEAVEAGQVEVIDLAETPGYPIGMSTFVTFALGLLAGLVFGGGAAFLKEHLNTAIRKREEIESVLQVPGLAVIPRIAGMAGRRKRIAGVLLPRLPRRTNGSGRKSQLVTVSNFRSSEAEAYRTLRTNLIFSQAIQTLRTIVITSPSPKDGKTTTAANLAVTFAQQGIRVLLVDCDLRKARLHAIFGFDREPGLTEAVLGRKSLNEVVRTTSVDGLCLITSGVIPPNPSELLGSPQMSELLKRLSSEYDVIVMDSPPLHVAADAQIVGSQADGVLLVLRAGDTDKQSAQEAVTRLASVGARLVGAVLNDPDHKVPSYGGYYYYSGYYGSDE
jgi:tyrosine-protein kinase Etk/Wzc